MLGPTDMDDWLDGDEDQELRARLHATPEIQLLMDDASLCELPRLNHFEFALVRLFVQTDYLDSNELRMLATRLGV